MIDQTRKFYFSPNDDTQAAYLDFLALARRKVRIADYSFNLDPVVSKLIEQKNAGLDVKLVLDRTQSKGSTEKPEIQKLVDGGFVQGIDFVIGTSSFRKIMHDKFTIVDDVWSQYGSWNYTAAASRENNFFVIEHSIDVAKIFSTNWQLMWDWISANEPQTA